ncbi:MAG: DNA polymerase I [Chlamydiota bacterium]|nr:DNA polymerase I [Chlamydiota bacterium]
MSKLFIIDASGFLYRSYHAIQNMTNPEGESTNALFGFIRSILKLKKDFSPSHIVAVFDGPNSTSKRKAIYNEYKANRSSMPEDLRYQIQWARDFCEMGGIPLLNISDVEADDTMGSVAVWASKEFEEVFLCTADKDMAQLVGNGIKLLNTHKDNLMMDSTGVKEKFGVPPEKIIDFLAITGDSSDNVPGLPGFGPKTAVTLLNDFDSLENILANPEKIPGKKKQETIRNESEKALISKELVTIDTSVDFPKENSFFQIKDFETATLQEFFSRMNFNSFLKEMGLTTENSEKEPLEYTLVDDEVELDQLITYLSKQKEVCFDTETTGLKPLQAELVGVGFCVEPKKAWYIPTNGKLGIDTVISKLKPLLSGGKVGLYGHNLKYDYQIMANYGISLQNICFDTILASAILNSHNRQHSLDALTLQYFNKTKIPTSDLLGKGKKQITMLEVPIQTVSDYCCEDVDYTCRLKLIFEEELKKRKLEKLFNELELPLLKILARMERQGIFLDTPCLKDQGVIVEEKIKDLSTEIHEIAGEDFNINSPKQLSHILFEKMGITPPKKTATGFSTNAEVLETLKADHPIAEKILDYRTVEKLRSTYIHTLPDEVNPKTHRIHCTFNQFVAATGRLSCQDPNLQNIPIRNPLGRNIREAFRPEKKGWSFLAADYSQIELRLLAHFSGDPNLIDAFLRGDDIHAHTASTIFKVPLEEVTKEMRYRAKAVNFGVIYGQQAFGLARELGIDFKDAKAFIDMYFETFPKVKSFIDSSKEKARKAGKATTITGRERILPEINSKNPQIRSAAERLAVNTPLQGSAADLIKKAMIKIDELLRKEDYLGYMILQIHDELIFELPDFEVPIIESIVKSNMENALKLDVPLVVNISIGKNWKEC